MLETSSSPDKSLGSSVSRNSVRRLFSRWLDLIIINNGIAICFSEEEDAVTTKKIVYGSRQNEATLAHSVFDALREADALGAETVYVHAPSKTGVGLAVYNRLIRAAAFRVIKL